MKNLQMLAKECMSELDAIGVEYRTVTEFTVNTRAKSRWGQCVKVSYGVFTINISESLLDDNLSDRPCKETIFHELIHTVDGCFDHKKKWQDVADLVNDCYGYNIKRTSSCEEKGIPSKEIQYKYTYQCSNCGAIVGRLKESKFTKHYERFGCGKCGAWHTFQPI